MQSNGSSLINLAFYNCTASAVVYDFEVHALENTLLTR